MADKGPTIVKSRRAVRDVVEIADYLAVLRTSLEAGNRFYDAVDRTFRRLARMPRIGSLWGDDDPDLQQVRFFPVTRYRRYLVFYRPIEGGIEILRVLHGARDLRRILRGSEDEG